MSNIPTIHDVGELLVLLRERLHTRAVSYIDDDLAVCDCADGNPGRPTRLIAWIDETGPARELLNKAYEATSPETLPHGLPCLALWTLLLDLGFIGAPPSRKPGSD